jgi:hypothetical protein
MEDYSEADRPVGSFHKAKGNTSSFPTRVHQYWNKRGDQRPASRELPTRGNKVLSDNAREGRQIPDLNTNLRWKEGEQSELVEFFIFYCISLPLLRTR